MNQKTRDLIMRWRDYADKLQEQTHTATEEEKKCLWKQISLLRGCGAELAELARGVLILTTILTMGCSGMPETLKVSSDPELLPYVESAALRWWAVTGRPIVVAPLGKSDIHISSVSGFQEQTGYAGMKFADGITVDAGVPDPEFVVLHEVGHAIQIVHGHIRDNNFGVMNTRWLVDPATGEAFRTSEGYVVNNPNLTDCITQADWNFVCLDNDCPDYAPEC